MSANSDGPRNPHDDKGDQPIAPTADSTPKKPILSSKDLTPEQARAMVVQSVRELQANKRAGGSAEHIRELKTHLLALLAPEHEGLFTDDERMAYWGMVQEVTAAGPIRPALSPARKGEIFANITDGAESNTLRTARRPLKPSVPPPSDPISIILMRGPPSRQFTSHEKQAILNRLQSGNDEDSGPGGHER